MLSLSFKLGQNCKIAKTAIIEDGVEIGDNCEISDYVIVRAGTKIGSNCKIYPHAVIGESPQDRSFQGEFSQVEIGNNVIIREFTTIHKAVGQGQVTKVGDDCYLMVMSHLGHNVELGQGVTLANNVALGGHVVLEDFVNVGGATVVHQHCRIGKYCMVSGLSAVNHDLVPFFTYGGLPSRAISTNRYIMKKLDFNQIVRTEIMRAFKIIYYSQSSVPVILERLTNELNQLDEIKYIINFIKNSKRGIPSARWVQS